MMLWSWPVSCISTSCVVALPDIIRGVLYESNHETQADPSDTDLLRRPRALPASRRGDLLRPQAGAGAIDRELLAGPAHDRLRRAGAPRERRLPELPPGDRGAAAQALRAHRARPRGTARLARRAGRDSPAAARRGDAEGLRRSRTGAAAAGAPGLA